MLYYILAGVSIGLFALTWLGFTLLVVILSSFMILLSLLNSRMKMIDKDMIIGFVVTSIVFSVIASPWYGADILPISSIALFSAAFSYVALRLGNSTKSLPMLVLLLVVCSALPLLFFRSELTDTGLVYIGLKDRGVYLDQVAELKTPNFNQFSQLYGIQVLLFIAGLWFFLTSIKAFKRENLFFLLTLALLMFLASTAIRFIGYFGIFVSVLSAYFIVKISDIISKSVKKDVFIPVMVLSAILFTQQLMPLLPTLTFSVSDDWHNGLQWLKNNSNPDSVVMSWWDYSQWVNGVAERKTVVNNQPPGRFDDQMIFFGTNDSNKAREMLKKYNVSYVIVSRGYLVRMPTSGKFLNETIEFNTASPSRIGSLFSARFGTGFKTFYDSSLNVAWDEYPDGKKVYYAEIGMFNQEQGTYRNQYVKASITGVEFNEDYLFMFSDLFIRIPAQTKNRVFFNLMYTNSTMPYLELVKDAGEVRIYEVV